MRRPVLAEVNKTNVTSSGCPATPKVTSLSCGRTRLAAAARGRSRPHVFCGADQRKLHDDVKLTTLRSGLRIPSPQSNSAKVQRRNRRRSAIEAVAHGPKGRSCEPGGVRLHVRRRASFLNGRQTFDRVVQNLAAIVAVCTGSGLVLLLGYLLSKAGKPTTSRRANRACKRSAAARVATDSAPRADRTASRGGSGGVEMGADGRVGQRPGHHHRGRSLLSRRGSLPGRTGDRQLRRQSPAPRTSRPDVAADSPPYRPSYADVRPAARHPFLHWMSPVGGTTPTASGTCSCPSTGWSTGSPKLAIRF